MLLETATRIFSFIISNPHNSELKLFITIILIIYPVIQLKNYISKLMLPHTNILLLIFIITGMLLKQ